MRHRGVLACGRNDHRTFPCDFVTFRIELKCLKSNVCTTKAPNLVAPSIRQQQDPGRYRDGHIQSLTGHFVDLSDTRLGELKLCKWGTAIAGTKLGNARPDEYMLMLRIQVAIVILALLPLYVVLYNEEALANRASITIVSVLTLVTFANERPQAVEFIPYATWHNIYMRIVVMTLVALSILSAIAPIACPSPEDAEHK